MTWPACLFVNLDFCGSLVFMGVGAFKSVVTYCLVSFITFDHLFNYGNKTGKKNSLFLGNNTQHSCPKQPKHNKPNIWGNRAQSSKTLQKNWHNNLIWVTLIVLINLHKKNLSQPTSRYNLTPHFCNHDEEFLLLYYQKNQTVHHERHNKILWKKRKISERKLEAKVLENTIKNKWIQTNTMKSRL